MKPSADRMYTREEVRKAFEESDAKGFARGDKYGRVAILRQCDHVLKYIKDKTGLPEAFVAATITGWDARVRLPNVVRGAPVDNVESLAGLGEDGGAGIQEATDGAQNERTGPRRRVSSSPALSDTQYRIRRLQHHST